MTVTFNDVKQDKMISNVSFKDSIEKIIIGAVVICKDVIYQSTGISCHSPRSIYHNGTIFQAFCLDTLRPERNGHHLAHGFFVLKMFEFRSLHRDLPISCKPPMAISRHNAGWKCGISTLSLRSPAYLWFNIIKLDWATSFQSDSLDI